VRCMLPLGCYMQLGGAARLSSCVLPSFAAATFLQTLLLGCLSSHARCLLLPANDMLLSMVWLCWSRRIATTVVIVSCRMYAM
jgi:hypothetical protein